MKGLCQWITPWLGRARSVRWWGITWVVSLALLGLSLWPVTSQAQQEGLTEMKISLAEAVQRALAKNLTIIVEKYNPEILTTSIVVEEAAFDPLLNLEGSFTTQRLPSASRLTGAGVSATENRTGQASLRQRLVTGATYEVTLNANRQDTNSTVIFLNPSYSSDITLTVSQPLLRNFGLEFNRSRIRIARLNREVSVERLRQVAIETVARVQNSYWDLVLAREIVQVRRRSLELAKDLERRNRIQIEAGVLAPIEIFQAEAAVASREADLITAEAAVKDAEDVLRNLLSLGEDFPRQQIELVPTDTPTVIPREFSLEESLKEALEKRPEIAQAKNQIASQDISVKQARNQVKPALDLTGFFGLNGLGGEISDNLDVLFSGRRYHAGLSLVFEYPLGNRAAQQNLKRANLAADQVQASLRRLQQDILLEVSTAVRRSATNLKRVEATRSARVLAEKKLDAEEKKFRVGLSTNFNILEFQNDLAVAQSEETRSLTDYSKAQVELNRATGRLLEVNNIIL